MKTLLELQVNDIETTQEAIDLITTETLIIQAESVNSKGVQDSIELMHAAAAKVALTQEDYNDAVNKGVELFKQREEDLLSSDG